MSAGVSGREREIESAKTAMHQSEAGPTLWLESGTVFLRLDVPVNPGQIFPSCGGWYRARNGYFPAAE